MSKGMTFNQYLRRYNPKRWKREQQRRRPFESNEDFEARILVEDLIKESMRVIRKAEREKG